MADTQTTYRMVEHCLGLGQHVPDSILLPEVYDNPDDGTYIDSVLSDFMDGYGASIDKWAVRNMLRSYGVSPEVAARALDRLIGEPSGLHQEIHRLQRENEELRAQLATKE